MARRLGASSRQRERQEQQAIAARVEAAAAREFRRIIRDDMDAASRAWERDGDMAVEGFLSDHRARVERALVSDYERAATAAGERLLRSAEKRHGRLALIVKEMPDEWTEAVQSFIRTYVGQKAKEIAGTTQDQLRSIILRGQEEGLGQSAIGALLRDQSPSLSRWRAGMIARTETGTAFSVGAQASADASGLDLQKEWIAAGAGERREAHQAVDGETVASADTFTVDGESLRYPRDPQGSAGNVINCACAAGYIEV